MISELQTYINEIAEKISVTERAEHVETGEIIAANLNGIFEMLGEIAKQLEQINETLKANDSD